MPAKVKLTKAQKLHKKLHWEYCECGCHGYELRIGDFYRWCFWDLKDKYYLNSGHCGQDLGVFKTFEEVDKAVLKDLKVHAKKQLEAFKEFV